MMSKLRFDGRVVVVTGAGAGLGRVYALLFASKGAKVVVNDLGSSRHGDGASRVADTVVTEIKSQGGQAVANYDNVLDGDKIIKTAIDSFGRIDVLVNNAGILRDKSFARMSDADWDIIQNVHVKGAMRATKAAWPYFKQQKYGKIIFTSSNSGLYGNFGQANYSSAKMALVGLANTLAIEGQSSGINTNVIVPTAGSRLTEDIVPPDFFQQLKPELIAPVVVWLCHENCTENGSIIESALGWAGKCHLIRSNGCILRKSINDSVTPEDVRDNWDKVTDMSNAKHCDSIAEATGELMSVVEQLSNRKADDSSSSSFNPKYTMKYSYNIKDVILYALGVGATTKNPSDFQYLYENHENFSVVPTYFVIFGPLGALGSDMLGSALPDIGDINIAGILHGEQYLKVLKKIPTEANVETRFRIQETLDKEKMAVMLIEHETYDVDSGDKLSVGQMVGVIKGAGGFGGPRNSKYEIPLVDAPKRKPDASVTQQTCVDQAAIYRLGSDDMNPLHIDESIAAMGGFEKPILHGLCSLGFATRHILRMFADNDTELFDSVKARFVKPVIPGQTLRTDMWRDCKRIYFQTTVVENNSPVIAGAYIDLKDVKLGTQSSKL
ncbi:peroxisomal multifunctional enzyme type 2 [Microplitis demolitor]|uniref:peroxisomal multifunctional enzyme type 2 n=1 Tax=Microplitis demolitor TaxID=69319 RepID=UPI0004CD3575|nr:peroxisomal multifunctional enzyme type 2 [Microplitis demolitor]